MLFQSPGLVPLLVPDDTFLMFPRQICLYNTKSFITLLEIIKGTVDESSPPCLLFITVLCTNICGKLKDGCTVDGYPQVVVVCARKQSQCMALWLIQWFLIQVYPAPSIRKLTSLMGYIHKDLSWTNFPDMTWIYVHKYIALCVNLFAPTLHFMLIMHIVILHSYVVLVSGTSWLEHRSNTKQYEFLCGELISPCIIILRYSSFLLWQPDRTYWLSLHLPHHDLIVQSKVKF